MNKKDKEKFSQQEQDKTFTNHQKEVEKPKSENKDNQKKPTESETKKAENVAELKKEIENLKDRNLRLLADIDNQRKLHVREMMERIKYSNEKLLQQLLSFPDNYERAIQASQKDQDPKIQNFLTGFKMIFNEFLNILKRQGVEEIKIVPLKNVYNDESVDLYEVKEKEENNNYPEGTILEVLRKGYRIHERILRPAEVKISKVKEIKDKTNKK